MERRVRIAAVTGVLGALLVAWLTALDLHGKVGSMVPAIVFYENGVVGPPFLSPGGAAYRVEGLAVMDRITRVNGEAVSNAAEILAAVERAAPLTTLRFEAIRADGRRRHADVEIRRLTESEVWELLLPFLLGGILLLAIGSIPILVRPDLDTARLFFLFTLTFTTNFGFLPYDYFSGYRFMPWSYVISFLSKASLLHLALVFPVRRWPLTRTPRLALTIGYGVLGLLSVVWVVSMYWRPAWMYYLDLLAMPTFTAGFVLLAANLAYTAWRSPEGIVRQRARVVLVGPVLTLVGWGLIITTSWSWRDLHVPTGTIVLLYWALPLSLAYGILKHNLFEFNAVIRRGINVGVFGLAAVLVYLAAFASIQRLVGIGTAWASAVLSALIVMVLVPVAQPLRRRLQDTVEELLFPDYRRASRAIHDASRELARLRGRAEVARHLRAAIQSSVRSARVRLVAGRPGEDLAELDPEPDQAPLEIPSGDRLQTLLSRGATVNLDQTGQTGSRVAKPIRDLLQRSNSRMLVPLPSSETLMGAFLLGARTDGRLYISDDEQLVETLAAQSSIAIENADAWEEVRRLQHRLENENVYLRRELELQHSFEEIVGAGVELKAALAQVEQVAPTDASVLVMGETGTGKELVVRAIHSLSGRRDRVLVKVACAAIPETLLESELFGHSRGAFTGASSSHRGRFDVADGGTIFFDDVDTLPLGIQAKLLRALQEGEIQRLGDTETRRVDVRVVASTNKDLLQEVREGRFREDLYYRLNVVPIQIPPLRARPGDIPLLVEYFLERESAKLGRQFRGIAEDTMTELCTYAWPGNVRELRNVIERAVVLCRDDVLRLPGPLAPVRPGEASPEGAGRGLAEKVRRYKIRLVTEALESADGNQRRAAEALGLHRPSLSRMIRDLGIRRPGEHPRRQVGRSRGEGRE